MIFLFFVVVVIFLWVLSNAKGLSFPWYKNGERLERTVNFKLRLYEKDGGKTLQGYYYRWRNGSTVQIDNILILRSGIYVIECKDYKGWIFGNDVADRWTVTYYGGRYRDSEKHSFYNPIKQNIGHIKYVSSRILGLDVPIHNIVVFSNNCRFKNITNNSDAYIIKEGILIDTVNAIDYSFGSVITPYEINCIYNRLKNAIDESEQVEQKHIETVYAAKDKRENEKNSNSLICPRCHGQLIPRNGKYGRFYGCSNYPNCDYTRKWYG